MGILAEVYGSNGNIEDMLSQIRNNAAMMNERDRQIAMQDYGVGNILRDAASTGFKGVTSLQNYWNTAPEYFRNVLYKGFNNFSEPDPKLREAFNQTMDKELLKSFGERQAMIEEYMPENPNSRIMTDKLSNVGQDALRAVAGLGTGALGFAGDLTKNTLVKAPAAVAAPLMDKPLDNDLIAFAQQSPTDVFSSALALPMEEGKEPGALEGSMHKFFGGVQKALKPVHEFGTWAAQESGHPVPELVGDLAGSAAEALAFEAAARGGKYAYGKVKPKVEKVLENRRLMREEKAAKQLEELEAKNKADAELLNSMSKADEVAGVEPPPGSVEGPSNLLDINKLKNKDLQLEVKQKQLEENLSKMREERNYLVDEGELKTIDEKIGKVEKEREALVANRAKYAEKIRENDPSTYDAENAIKSDRERAVDSEAEAKSAEANVATKETLEDTLKAYSEYLDTIKKGQPTNVVESESAPLVRETRRASDLIDVENTANYEVLSAKLDEVSAMVDKLRTPTESVSVVPEVSAVEPTTLQIGTEFNPANYSLKSKEFKELSAVQKKQVYVYQRQQKIAEKEAKQTGENKSSTATATIKKEVVPETLVETKTEVAPTPEVDLTTIRVNSKEYKGLTKEQKLAVREYWKAEKAKAKAEVTEIKAEEKSVESVPETPTVVAPEAKVESTNLQEVLDKTLGKPKIENGIDEKVTTKEATEAPPLVIKNASKLKAEVAKEKVDKQKAVLDKLEESSNAIHQMEDTVDLSEAITKLEATHTKLENELRQQGLSYEAVEAHPIIQKVKEVRAKYEAAWEALPEDIKNSLDAEPIKVAKESVSPVSRPFREILRDITTVFKDETGAVGNLSDILSKEVLEAKARLKEDAARLGRSLADHLKILGVKPDVIAMMTGEVPRVAGVTTNITAQYENTKAINDTKVRHKKINDGTTYAISKPPVFVQDIMGMLQGKNVKFGALVNAIHSFEKAGTYAKEKLFDRFNELDTNKKREIRSYEHLATQVRNSLSRQENIELRHHMLAQRGGGVQALARSGVDPAKLKPLNDRQLKAAKILEAHYASFFDRVNDARVKNGLEPFDRVENYTTFFTDLNAIAEHMQLDPINMDIAAFKEARSHVNDTSFKFADRASNKKALDIDLTATEAFSKYANKALHQIHMQPLVSFTKELLGDFKYNPLTGEKMKFGTWSLKNEMPDTAAGISKWINAVARNSKEIGDLLSPSAARLISKYQYLNTLGTLAYRATTVMSQPSSIITVPMYLGKSAVHIMPRALDIMMPKNYKLAEKLSNVLSSRTFTQEVADLISSIKERGAPGFVQKVAELGMKPMTMLDTAMAYYTWQMGFKEARGRGLNMEKAARYADDLVLKTQGSGNIGHVAPVQTSVLGSAATMYQTYNIAFVNAIVHEIGKDVRVNPVEAAKKAIILTGSIAAMNQMYSALGLDSPLPEPERAAWEWKESGRPAFDAIKPVMSELLSPTGITSGRSNPLIQNTRKIVAPSNKREFMEGLLNSIGAPTEIPGMIMRYNEEGKNVIPRQRRIVSASTK